MVESIGDDGEELLAGVLLAAVALDEPGPFFGLGALDESDELVGEEARLTVVGRRGHR